MTFIFQFLCQCLNWLGRLVGWDYYTASVYICIHLWPVLCVVMSVVMLVVAIGKGNGWWITVCAIYALINGGVYYAIVRHYYPGTIPEIFNHCYNDLMTLAAEWHTTYAIVNLLIYIVLFALIMVADFSAIHLMRQS